MKKYLLPFLALLLISISGCQNSDNAQTMLQDENERQQVYNTILENEEMRNELMVQMRERNMGESMMGRGGMAGNRGMVGDTTGMSSMNRQQMQARMQEMMAQCDTDTAACTMMSEMMLQNRALMGNMMRQIRQRGQMDQGCMQQLMREIGL
ncbi:hypothetical protein [uncultured Pontibacter sp.]|uniref:hypothetical protein n=1 Tax=uncultured Pontibacter sp. TaxID=453356 RepID=UPI0026050B7A|nr:hypothetical protein [uncultured Pontibacter sp.]